MNNAPFKLPYKNGVTSPTLSLDEIAKRLHFLDVRTKELETVLAALTQEGDWEDEHEDDSRSDSSEDREDDCLSKKQKKIKNKKKGSNAQKASFKTWWHYSLQCQQKIFEILRSSPYASYEANGRSR